MARKTKKSSSFTKLFMLGFLAVVIFALGSYLLTSRSSKVKDIFSGDKPVVTITPKPQPPKPEHEVTIYVPEVSKNETYLVPKKVNTSAEGESVDISLQALIDTPEDKSGGIRIIPKDTKLLESVKIKRGLATVNFSKEFADNFQGGSSDEAVTLNAIAHTIVNSNSKVKKIRILVEGEPIESLGGHFDLTEPLTADSTMLK